MASEAVSRKSANFILECYPSAEPPSWKNATESGAPIRRRQAAPLAAPRRIRGSRESDAPGHNSRTRSRHPPNQRLCFDRRKDVLEPLDAREQLGRHADPRFELPLQLPRTDSQICTGDRARYRTAPPAAGARHLPAGRHGADCAFEQRSLDAGDVAAPAKLFQSELVERERCGRSTR